ncbi:hypothetical protein NMY22_g1392 [Coprinellus aureogranulatus]|nr:hypothetical protein NMY22_g1392 [Coprinellus aureogranulatus]
MARGGHSPNPASPTPSLHKRASKSPGSRITSLWHAPRLAQTLDPLRRIVRLLLDCSLHIQPARPERRPCLDLAPQKLLAAWFSTVDDTPSSPSVTNCLQYCRASKGDGCWTDARSTPTPTETQPRAALG